MQPSATFSFQLLGKEVQQVDLKDVFPAVVSLFKDNREVRRHYQLVCIV